MIRLAVFDLDNTLAPLGKGVAPEDLRLLRQLEASGAAVAVCSGKPAYYLCGFLRQAELARPILIGENGAVIQFGVDLPPREYHVSSGSEAAQESIRFLRQRIRDLLPGIWFQPNEVCLTPFPRSEAEFDAIEAALTADADRVRDLRVFRHNDSFDFVPEGIDKASGLRRLCGLLQIDLSETAAVGDGVNDYPMFACAGLSLGVRVTEGDRVDKNFASVTEALRYLLRAAKEQNP